MAKSKKTAHHEKSDEAKFKEGFKYPLNNFARIFNYYWMLVPILGIFAVYGYLFKIIESIAKGSRKELPEFGSFFENMKEGFLALVFIIPLVLLFMVGMMIPFVSYFIMLVYVVCIPMLIINYAVERKFMALFDFKKVFDMIFSDFGDYVWTYLKSILLGLVWVLCSIPVITLIATMPAMMFSQHYFIADFYARHKKQ